MRSYVPTHALGLQPPDDLSPWGAGPLAVFTPVIRAELSADEAISLASLRAFAPAEAVKFLVVPEGVQPAFDAEGFVVKTLPAANFRSVETYSGLMLQPWFYDLFAGFAQMLVFQTDCLLLGPGLSEWCARDYAYVGAPWFDRRGRPKSVGNGGFSLRKVAMMRAVLAASDAKLSRLPGQSLRHFMGLKHTGVLRKVLRDAAQAPGDVPFGARVAAGFFRPEDEFWSYYAPMLLDGYRLPSAREAAGFAAESRVAEVFALNGGAPLGAHAWTRFDRSLWEAELARLGLNPVKP